MLKTSKTILLFSYCYLKTATNVLTVYTKTIITIKDYKFKGN